MIIKLKTTTQQAEQYIQDVCAQFSASYERMFNDAPLWRIVTKNEYLVNKFLFREGIEDVCLEEEESKTLW